MTRPAVKHFHPIDSDWRRVSPQWTAESEQREHAPSQHYLRDLFLNDSAVVVDVDEPQVSKERLAVVAAPIQRASEGEQKPDERPQTGCDDAQNQMQNVVCALRRLFPLAHLDSERVHLLDHAEVLRCLGVEVHA
jgi:hypothetical protein